MDKSFTVLQRFTEGCWGPNARVNNPFNGGPECAAQVPLYFIIATIVIMSPVYYYSITSGTNKLLETHWKKRDELQQKNMLNPTKIEQVMGIICIMCILANLYYKWHTMTMIFMFNPCHVVCVSMLLVSGPRKQSC